jgi:hypothetical protein
MNLFFKGIVDFLIMPVQRIPRYSLLLNDLLKHTPTDHVDHAGLEAALNKINAVAHFINDTKAAQDDFVHVNEIQSRLTDTNYSLLHGKRKLIREDRASLVKIDGLAEPSTEEVMAYFFSDCMIFATKARKKISVKHWIWLQELLPADPTLLNMPPASELCIRLQADGDRVRERRKLEDAMEGLEDGEICFIVASLTVDGMTKMRCRIAENASVKV